MSKFDRKNCLLLTIPYQFYCLGLVCILLGSVPQVVAQSKKVEFTSQEVNAIIAHGPWPGKTPADPANELSGLPWAEKLGESLFSDNTLSANQAISCASCHQQDSGFTDNLPVGIGIEQGVRNTQGLLDVGLQRWFGWDGGADSLWAATVRPMLNAHEMGNNTASLASALRSNDLLRKTIQTHYDYQFASTNSLNKPSLTETDAMASLGDEELIVIAAKSIAAFMLTLRSERTAFDLFRDALENEDTQAQLSYSESAQRGLKIFIGEANCRVCHFGKNFSNGEFHDTGRSFFTGVGQVDPGRYTGIKRVKQDPFNLLGKYGETSSNSDKLKTAEVKLSQLNWGQWRTPSLRNLALTGPYMHDGSLKTLREVVDAYADIDTERLHAKGESVLKPLDLSNDQRNDLVNFLLSLSLKE